MDRIVFFDFETSGLGDEPEIQLAAVATTRKWEILDEFQEKIQFDPEKANPEALKMNHYDPEVWAKEARPEKEVVRLFGTFLSCHATVPMVSKRTGCGYNVARLAGHNIVTFDRPRLDRMFKRWGVFLPAHPLMLDTLQRAMWLDPGGHLHDGVRLVQLADRFGVDPSGAHDALADCRLCVQVCQAAGW